MALRSLLATQPVAILDGGIGTELERRGININNSKLWSAKLLTQDPQVLHDIHRDYYDAGADICSTSSYQASVQGFVAEGSSPQEANELFVRAVDLCDAARTQFWEEHCEAAAAHAEGSHADGMEEGAGHARRSRPLVAFSCGAYGAYLADGSEYTGAYADSMTVEQLMQFHESRLQPIKGNAAIDVLAFETIPCLKEAEAIVRLLETGGYGVDAWISFSCRDGDSTNHGESFAGACVPLAMRCPAVAAVGVNCIKPEHARPLLAGAKAAAASLCAAAGGGRAEPPLLLCYPNSGEAWDCTRRCWLEGTGTAGPEGYASEAKLWVQAGARIVGGCCRTTPQHIAALRQALLPF